MRLMFKEEMIKRIYFIYHKLINNKNYINNLIN